MEKTTDVYGVGNAIVDTLAFVDDDFIRENDLQKGGMTLSDSQTQASLLGALSHKSLELRSGGSAANTMIGIARSGGSGFYTGKVARDPNGEFYRKDLLDAGIHFDVHPLPESTGPTGTCVVMTTPDAERTMYTHLGVSVQLSEKDIEPDRIAKSRYVYVEGYLFDGEGPRKACFTALEEARKNNAVPTFTFSDPFLVGRYREDLHALVRDYCDVVFMNDEEARGFTEMESLEESARYIGNIVDTAFITNGKKGAIVVHNKEVFEVPGFSVKAIDTNGAGDSFAAGALFALARGKTPPEAAKWGNFLASEIVQIHGARLDKDYSGKFQEVLS
ncbi:MAG: adenosine kinase [Leptospiraceae bacterium]|nr:adenosine kinase [Leptospiraceae bacterium]MCB1303448.1 adenosine kinase [Leptospiraceae bacterium]